MIGNLNSKGKMKNMPDSLHMNLNNRSLKQKGRDNLLNKQINIKKKKKSKNKKKGQNKE